MRGTPGRRRAAAVRTCRPRSPAPPARRGRSSLGRSSSVISTGPSTCSAIVSSWPWGDSVRVGGHRARRCARVRRAARRRARSANRRTSSRSDTSQRSTTNSARAPPLEPAPDLAHPSPRRVRRAARRAPRRANPSAVASPRPEVAPVTAAVWPASAPGAGSSGQPGSRRRTAGPILVNPGATVRSISGVDAAGQQLGGREVTPAASRAPSAAPPRPRRPASSAPA